MKNKLKNLSSISISILFVVCFSCSKNNNVPENIVDIPDSSNLSLKSSIEKDGVTWTFSEPVQTGTYVTGDYYIVGDATITNISPSPTASRNGSVLNIPLDNGVSGFDDRVSSNRFSAFMSSYSSLRKTPPFDVKPGDALVSSISDDPFGSTPAWLMPGENSISPVLSYSILTIVAAQPPENSFRPSYGDRNQVTYNADDLNLSLLKNVSLSGINDVPDITEFAEHFRRPWLDICFFNFDIAADYQASYARETGRSVGIAALLLNSDYTDVEKRDLLIGFVQYGIDLWGWAKSGHKGWPAHGGHGSGRKLPIIFAGMLLGDTDMAAPTKTQPELRFGEDMQTMYDNSWTGANTVYAGHQGVINGENVSSTPGWGRYEHLPPENWHEDHLGESYRRCCTCISWVGQATVMKLMNAEDNWNHPAFFDYVNRWMTEDDTKSVRIIMENRGWDYSAGWQRQGQTWDTFVNEMFDLLYSKTD